MIPIFKNILKFFYIFIIFITIFICIFFIPFFNSSYTANNNDGKIIDFNPNGSTYAVEGITSADGRILGKMGHSERIGKYTLKNIHGEKDQKIFESGVNYFK